MMCSQFDQTNRGKRTSSSPCQDSDDTGRINFGIRLSIVSSSNALKRQLNENEEEYSLLLNQITGRGTIEFGIQIHLFIRILKLNVQPEWCDPPLGFRKGVVSGS